MSNLNPDPHSPAAARPSRFGTPGLVALALVVGAGATWLTMRHAGGPGGPDGAGYAGCSMPAQSGGMMGCGMMRAPAAGRPGNPGKVLFYRNPMNPAITSPVFMKDEMGMDYLPVYSR